MAQAPEATPRGRSKGRASKGLELCRSARNRRPLVELLPSRRLPFSFPVHATLASHCHPPSSSKIKTPTAPPQIAAMLPKSRIAAYTSCPFSPGIVKTLKGTRISSSGTERARFTLSPADDLAHIINGFPGPRPRVSKQSNVGATREQRRCAGDAWHSLRIVPIRNDLHTERSRNRRETTSGRSKDCVRGYLVPVFLGIGRKFSQVAPPVRMCRRHPSRSTSCPKP
jgi:hypothetical protein